MKKKLLFVFNPKSGKGLIKEHLVNIVDIMTKAGYKITIYPTQCQGDAIKKVRKNAKKYDLVVCSGGDGTLDEVVTGMEQSEVNVPIGYIPAGSTNDFANSLGIPKNMEEAAPVSRFRPPSQLPRSAGNPESLRSLVSARMIQEETPFTPSTSQRELFQQRSATIMYS